VKHLPSFHNDLRVLDPSPWQKVPLLHPICPSTQESWMAADDCKGRRDLSPPRTKAESTMQTDMLAGHLFNSPDVYSL